MSPAGTRSHDDIPGFTDVTTGFDVEDRDSYGGTVGFGRQMSKSTTLGVAYNYNHFDLDLSGSEDSHEMGLTLGHQISRRRDLSAFVGVFRRLRRSSHLRSIRIQRSGISRADFPLDPTVRLRRTRADSRAVR